MFPSSIIFKIIGALGLLCITGGVLLKQNKKQHILFASGGVLLEIYSIYIGDFVFIVLQAVFIAAAVWNIFRKV